MEYLVWVEDFGGVLDWVAVEDWVGVVVKGLIRADLGMRYLDLHQAFPKGEKAPETFGGADTSPT